MSSSKERSPKSLISKHLVATASFTSMKKKILESTMQEVIKTSLLDNLNKLSRANKVYNKRTKMVEESILVVFDENNDGSFNSTLFQDLKLDRHENAKETPESNKAITRSLSQGTLNQ